jgi:hypothetical protein
MVIFSSAFIGGHFSVSPSMKRGYADRFPDAAAGFSRGALRRGGGSIATVPCVRFAVLLAGAVDALRLPSLANPAIREALLQSAEHVVMRADPQT